MIHLAILGSTNGTDLIAIHNAIKSGKLSAQIDIIISNKKNSGILQKAKEWNLNHIYIKQIKNRKEYDEKILKKLKKYNIDLILLIGWMRILSPVLIKAYKNKTLNVHPSLLPKFAGGMNNDVHAKILKAGETETGCTIHLVDEGIDTGKIILQKKTKVEPQDTVETLKEKVQKLEGEAFIEVIKNYKTNN